MKKSNVGGLIIRKDKLMRKQTVSISENDLMFTVAGTVI